MSRGHIDNAGSMEENVSGEMSDCFILVPGQFTLLLGQNLTNIH